MQQKQTGQHRASFGTIVVLTAIVVSSASCANTTEQASAPPAAPAPTSDTAANVSGTTTSSVDSAKAALQSIPKVKAKGEISFSKTEDGVKVIADITGLKPKATHGLHIHENGECKGNFASAGDHFNPTNSVHGSPTSENRHLGDLGNVIADKKGRAKKEIILKGVSLDGANSIVGKSMILHAGPDDLNTQPSGGSGGRIACGIIQTEQSTSQSAQQ